jgi:hypothetical protein
MRKILFSFLSVHHQWPYTATPAPTTQKPFSIYHLPAALLDTSTSPPAEGPEKPQTFRQHCGAKIISFGSGSGSSSTEPQIRIAAPAPAPVPTLALNKLYKVP